MNRQVTILIGLVIVGLGIGIMYYLFSLKEPPKRFDASAVTPVILTKKVSNGNVANQIELSGKLTADNRVEVYSEVQGVLLSSPKLFKEGQSYVAGESMLKLDSTEFYLNLMATKSSYLNMLVQLGPDIKFDFPESYESWNSYVAQIDISKPIPPIPESKNEKARNFLTSRDVYNQYFMIKSQEEKLNKYHIKAPFSGVLSEGNLHPGSMVRVGQKLGTFIRSGVYELDAAVNLSDANAMQVGDSVKLTSDNYPGEWIGRVKRISAHLDKSTQTVKVYISVKSDNLKEGMYLSGFSNSGNFDNATVLPRKLLIGTNQVYTVVDSALKLQEVDVLSIGENQVVVAGIPDGTLLMDQVFSAAYNGLKVKPQLAQ